MPPVTLLVSDCDSRRLGGQDVSSVSIEQVSALRSIQRNKCRAATAEDTIPTPRAKALRIGLDRAADDFGGGLDCPFVKWVFVLRTCSSRVAEGRVWGRKAPFFFGALRRAIFELRREDDRRKLGASAWGTSQGAGKE
jgi:hypothetical protein